MVDVAIGLLLVMLSAGALHSRTLYGSLTLFFAFGMVMALAWARLRAPDLALAEAAIGAGLSGALLFNALSSLTRSPPERPPRRLRYPTLATVLIFTIFLLLIQGLLPALERRPLLPAMVESRLAESGVDYPVTAVLLNFRAWDTLLELTVLVLALLGLKVLNPSSSPPSRPWPLLLSWGKTLAPITVVVGGYLLWHGSHGPGGAFQAGALIAAGAVMLRLNHALPAMRWSNLWVRTAVLAGVSLFLGVAVVTAWLGSGWLVYPAANVKPLVMAIEVTATISIAAALALLVEGEGEELQS